MIRPHLFQHIEYSIDLIAMGVTRAQLYSTMHKILNLKPQVDLRQSVQPQRYSRLVISCPIRCVYLLSLLE